MQNFSLTTLIFIVILINIAIAVITVKFMKDKKTEDKSWKEYQPIKIKNVKATNKLSILPLVEYYTAKNDLFGEPGVSYLITTDDMKILFDVGYNQNKEHPSPLLKNMEKLNVKLSDIDYIFVSHLHRDHIGGNQNERKKTLSVSNANIDLKDIKIYTPTEMSYPTATIEVINSPKIISEGVVSIGPISRALWLMGLTAEQALAINVERKGIVLIVGCGHQRIERIIQRTKELFDLPIYGLIGGLHYPVTASRMAFNVQRFFGTGKLPWQWITKKEVIESLDNLANENLSIIGLSAHDSCDWSLGIFKETFKNKFIDVMVGKEIVIK